MNFRQILPGILAAIFALVALACSDPEGFNNVPDDCPNAPTNPDCQAYCDTDPTASWCDTANNINNTSPNNDAGNNVTNNDAGNNTDVDAGECTEPADCPVVDGTTAMCDAGVCEYDCADGFVDLNSDLAADGCECEVTSETDLCDGIDNDCDGDTDEDQAELACGLTQGVCEDSTFTCPGANPAEACGAAQYGLDWNESDDERWRCDSLDNDCDGDSDEACCAAPGDLAPTSYGATSSQFPAITPALDNTGAAFLLAWAEGTDVKLAHVDALGTEVGTGEILGNLEITSVAVATAPNGYEVAFTTEDNGLYGLRATTVASDLIATSLETPATSNEELVNVDIATTDTHSCLVWSQSQMLNNSVQLTCFGHGDAANAPAPVEVTETLSRTTNAAIPAIETIGDDVLIAWWDNNDVGTAKVHVQEWSTSLSSSAATSSGVTRENAGTSEPLAVAISGDTAHILMLDYDTTNFERQISTLPYDITGDSFGSQSVVIDSGAPTEQSAIATDSDDDGILDTIIVTYVSDGDLLVGTFPAATPGLISNPVTLQSGNLPAAPALSTHDYHVGSYWLRTQGVTATRFAPLSRGAAPICGL